MTLLAVPAAGVVYNDVTNKLQRGGVDLSSSPAIGDLPTVTIAKGGTGQTTAALARTALGLAIGSDVQAYAARLADVAAVGVTANSVLAGNGSNLVLATLTALLDAVFGSTRGMILTRGAATWGALAIGSANKLLKTDGTDPSWATLSALIDGAIGSTQGQILYRGASTWDPLATSTAGYLLKTGGAGANPSWVANHLGSLSDYTEWTAFTPTGAHTNCTYFGYYKIDGKSVHLRIWTTYSNAPAAGGLTIGWQTPTGLTMDTSTMGTRHVCGNGFFYDASAVVGRGPLECQVFAADGLIYPGIVTTAPNTIGGISNGTPVTIANGDGVFIDVPNIPIT